MAEDFMEDLGGQKPQAPAQAISAEGMVSQFTVHGEATEHDPKGVLDENIKLRQGFARMFASKGEQLMADPDAMQMFMKLLSDNDKSIVAQARLKVDEKGNAAASEMVTAIVREAIAHGDAMRMQYMQSRLNPTDEPVVIDHSKFDDIELPPASRTIEDNELVMGTSILTEKEIAKGAGIDAIPEGTNTHFDD